MIDTPEMLDVLVERALAASCIAIDTEFVWERTYYPRLGVVQLGFSEADTVLIDAVALDDLTPLGRVLAAPQVVKVLHDATQDLVILRRATGAAPRSIFDTQRAAGFVGLGATLSLGDLLRAALDVSLLKTSARTNWLQRPLSEEQYAYAHNDVRYLPAARGILQSRARQHGREAWLDEEMAAYDDPTLYEEKDPRTQYLRIGGVGRLSPRQRAVLRELTAWREEEARRRNQPRHYIMADKVLAAAARRIPRSRADLSAVRGLDERTRRRHGDDLLDGVARGLAVPEEACPPAPMRPPDDEALTARVHFLLAYLTGKGLADGIDPALVASRSDVVFVVVDGLDAAPDRHTLLRGWRRAFIGDDLMALLAGQHTVRLDTETGLPRLG